MIASVIVGLLFNIVGTSLAGRALYLDWKEHGQGRPMFPWLTAASVWIRVHVLRRRRNVYITTGSAAVSLSSMSGAITVTSAPPESASTREQVTFLLREVRALHTRVSEVEASARTRIDAVEASVTEARNDAQAAVARVEGIARDVAVGTVRLQMFGLFLIGIGSVVSVLPVLLGWI